MKKLCLILSCLLLSLSSCDNGFEALNENPNSPTTTNIDYLFTDAMVQYAAQGNTGIYTHVWTLMEWMQMKADINGLSQLSDAYAYGGSNNDALWQQWYVHVLGNIQAIIRLSTAQAHLVNKRAIARIWRAYMFQRISDLWGAVPYTQALDPQNLSPVYDAQAFIYPDLLNELAQAVSELDDNRSSFDAADPLYNGQVNAWRKFANALRLRIAIRLSAVDPILAQNTIETVTASGALMTSNSDGAHFNYTNDTRSAFFQLYDAEQGFRQPSAFLINQLKSTNDPRLPFYAEATQESQIFGADDYVGIPNLLLSTQVNDYSAFNTSVVGGWFLQATTRGTTLSYAEQCFLLAEAALKGYNVPQSAEAYYNEGVKAALLRFNIAEDAINAYLDEAPITFNASLAQIIGQKWLTLVYVDAYEAFAEYRRTGFPALQHADATTIDVAQFPQRFPYPDSEVNLNGEAVTVVGHGINDMTTKMWWVE